MRPVYTLTKKQRDLVHAAVARYMGRCGFREDDKFVPPEMVTAVIDLLVIGEADLKKISEIT